MSNFSADQLKSIAQSCHNVSVSVAQFRLDCIHGGASLNDPGIVQLLGLQIGLLNTAGSFSIQAAQVTLADADMAANQIVTATKAANDAIRKLQVVDKVLSIGSAVGVVVAAAMTGNMNQIATAANGVFTIITGSPAATAKKTGA